MTYFIEQYAIHYVQFLLEQKGIDQRYLLTGCSVWFGQTAQVQSNNTQWHWPQLVPTIQ